MQDFARIFDYNITSDESLFACLLTSTVREFLCGYKKLLIMILTLGKETRRNDNSSRGVSLLFMGRDRTLSVFLRGPDQSIL